MSPQFNDTAPAFKPRKSLEAEWKTFRKGLNLLLRPTELTREEYTQGDNIMLVGSGTPTGRWGTSKYFTANASLTTKTIRGFGVYADTDSDISEILTLSDIEGRTIRNEKVAYYLALQRKCVEPLRRWNFIEIRPATKRGKIHITQEGKNMLKFLG